MAAPMKKIVSENLLRCNLFKGLTWSRVLMFYQQKQFKHSETYNLDSSQTEGKTHEREIPTSKLELYQKFLMQPNQPPNAKILRVAIIGAPNAGKSTLMNQLTRWKVAAVSKKVNCTRKNTMSVLTKDDTQIVFLDTPGARNLAERRRYHDKTMMIDPLRSLDEADLVTVLVDAENRFTRTQLNEHILRILHLNPHIPSILVLNKCDIVKNKQVLLNVTDVLTQGVVDGQSLTTKKVKQQKKPKEKEEKEKIKEIFDRYENYLNLKNKDKSQVDGRNWIYKPSRAKEGLKKALNQTNEQANSDFDSNRESLSQKSLTESQEDNEDSSSDIIDSNTDQESDSEETSENSPNDGNEDQNFEQSNIHEEYSVCMTKLKSVTPREPGWSNFSNVFMISAIDGDGVDELENYLFSQAKPGDWEYHSSLVTDVGPYELAKECIWEKLLDFLPKRLPYLLYPQIQDWEINSDGTLCINMYIETANDYEARLLIGKGGGNIKQIALEAQQELMNAFRHEVLLSLQVKVQEKPRKRKSWSN